MGENGFFKGGWILLLAICIPLVPLNGKSIDKLIVSEYAVSDPAFRDLIGNLTGTPLLPGNQVITLINGVQIFPPQFAAIRAATNTVTMENFIFRSGQLSAELVPFASTPLMAINSSSPSAVPSATRICGGLVEAGRT